MIDSAPLNFFNLGRPPSPSELAELPPDTLVVGRHITTCPNGGTSLEKYSLLPLRDVLTLNTPLRQFLADHSIQYDHKKRVFLANGQMVPLINCMESCASCLVDKALCRLVTRESKRVLSKLYPRLLYEDGDPAFYLYYSPEEEASLPEAKAPQVLRLLDELLQTLEMPAGLAEEWAKECDGRYHVIEKEIRIKQIPQQF